MRTASLVGMIAILVSLLGGCTQPQSVGNGERVVITVDSWKIIGNYQEPETEGPAPAVLLLHMMPTDRTSFNNLADLLAERGVASLRIDLRGHGESTNLKKHNPDIDAKAWRDVLAAVHYLRTQKSIDPTRIGILGASYSGEQAAIAGREISDIKAFVIMSCGSFSESSIKFVADSEAPWLFIAAKDDSDADVPETMQKAAAAGPPAELDLFDTGGHGTLIFAARPELEARIADWFAEKLK